MTSALASTLTTMPLWRAAAAVPGAASAATTATRESFFTEMLLFEGIYLQRAAAGAKTSIPLRGTAARGTHRHQLGVRRRVERDELRDRHGRQATVSHSTKDARERRDRPRVDVVQEDVRAGSKPSDHVPDDRACSRARSRVERVDAPADVDQAEGVHRGGRGRGADAVGRPEQERPHTAGRPDDRRLRAQELPDDVPPLQAREARMRPRVVAHGAEDRLGAHEPRAAGGAAPHDEEGRPRTRPPEQLQHARCVRARPVVEGERDVAAVPAAAVERGGVARERLQLAAGPVLLARARPGGARNSERQRQNEDRRADGHALRYFERWPRSSRSRTSAGVSAGSSPSTESRSTRARTRSSG